MVGDGRRAHPTLPGPPPGMPNGSARTGRGATPPTAAAAATLPRQTRPRTGRDSRASTSSCPAFSERPRSDPEEEEEGGDRSSPPPRRCPSSLSSPSLRGSLSSLQSAAPSLASSSPSPSPSPSPSASSSLPSASSSEDDSSWDTNSWSSGATCLLRSTIKRNSEEAFQARLGPGGRTEPTSVPETGRTNGDSVAGACARSHGQQGAASEGWRDSAQSLSSSQGATPAVAAVASGPLEQTIEAKLKFSQFLDEVTCRVLAPGSLQAFGALRPSEPPAPWDGGGPSSCSSAIGEAGRGGVADSVYRWSRCLPSCKVLDGGEAAREERGFREPAGKAYLETDIDSMRTEDGPGVNPRREVKKESLAERERERERERRATPRATLERRRSPSPLLSWAKDFPKYTYRSTSLPRGISCRNASMRFDINNRHRHC
ncbi:hypothetical protein AAFF_G00048030 [Aldrovandia affinis]|uniref:Uncharacterized protein n=1 Tax=Aldrovandia affinis TaxID=143900 RepID=A0AAD7S1L3_9TELE|nr:hypothetical protein AAFF_G00048030 [Aldrovandia affinis]